ncbi:hypothetical protein [Caballeronia sp. LZ035]|uniref:hypothetical protein n=1 Tax=Caballeronia sp. LZ035 TaxID=3038568 RepID=UPI0028549732|nr:hypothetical protein [Caballeronia sp. LZ035]MDR5760431.1 hypothetical protein [Caballeronia sp. LZ035]
MLLVRLSSGTPTEMPLMGLSSGAQTEMPLKGLSSGALTEMPLGLSSGHRPSTADRFRASR